MKTPPADDLRLAAEWLRQFEGTQEGDADVARAAAVAEWLDEQAQAKDVREVSRESGIPASRVRASMRASLLQADAKDTKGGPQKRAC